MPPDHTMVSMSLPDKKTFVEQTADHLRDQILSGTWNSMLPAERELAAELQVARNTLRNAIQMITDEGLLYMPEGRRRHYIVHPEAESEMPPPARPSVVFLTDAPLNELPSHTLLRADLIRRSLNQSGQDS